MLVEAVDPRTAFTALLDQVLTADRRELEALFGTDTDKVVKLARAARSGLFLAVSTCKDFLEGALERIEGRMRGLEDCGVRVEEGEITSVTYDCSVPHSTYRAFAALWAMYSAVKGGGREVERGRLLDRANKYADAVAKAIVESELEPLDPKRLASRPAVKEGEWLDIFVAKPSPQGAPAVLGRSGKGLGEVDQKEQRNFAAHAGLLGGLACFKLHGGKVYLKYCVEGADPCELVLKYIV